MADRHEERYRGEPYRGERGHGREERSVMDRARDLVENIAGVREVHNTLRVRDFEQGGRQ